MKNATIWGLRGLLAGLLITLGVGKLMTPYVNTLAVPAVIYYSAMMIELVLGFTLISPFREGAARWALAFFALTVLGSIFYDGDCG